MKYFVRERWAGELRQHVAVFDERPIRRTYEQSLGIAEWKGVLDGYYSARQIEHMYGLACIPKTDAEIRILDDNDNVTMELV